MKLQSRLRKVIAVAAIAGTLATSTAVFAADYTGHWAESAIEEWKGHGVIEGYENGAFKPKQEVTRAELAKMLVQVFELTEKAGAQKFTDIPEQAWYEEYVALVSAAGLMPGTEGNFRPNAPATREEAAYAIATAYSMVEAGEVAFSDQAAISEWAEASVASLAAGGYLNGYPDGSFKPQGTLTRAEIVTLLDKITADLIRETGIHTKDINGNVVVSAKGVTLKDMTINGNLYLVGGIGKGTVTLDNVTVTGKIIIEGAGVESVQIKGKSKIKEIVVDKCNNQSTVVGISGTAAVTGEIKLESPTIIEGTAATLPKVVVDGAQTVEIKGSVKVKEVEVVTKATVTLTGNKVEVEKVQVDKNAAETKLAGNGKVDAVHADADKVVIDKNINVEKDKITAGKDVTVPPVVEKPSGGGGGGGGGITTPVLKLEKAYITLTDGSQVAVDIHSTPIHIESTTSGITINGAKFTPDMQIQSASATVSNTDEVTVSIIPGTLDNVTLKADYPYTIADLAAMVEAKEDDVYGIIEMFERDGALTAHQADRARTYLTKALDIFAQSAGDESVSVASIQHYIASAKTKIQSIGVDRINEELREVLKMADIKIQEIDKTIKIDFTLNLSGKDGSNKSINVKLTF